MDFGLCFALLWAAPLCGVTVKQPDPLLRCGWRAGGEFQEGPLVAALTTAKHPARNPAQNVSDIRAQMAANVKGRPRQRLRPPQSLPPPPRSQPWRRAGVSCPTQVLG